MADDPLEKQRKALERDVERKQARAANAKQLLEQPLMKEALAAHDTGVVELWKRSAPDAVEERERLWKQLQAGAAFRLYLQKTLESGKVAAVTAARVLDGSSDRAGGSG